MDSHPSGPVLQTTVRPRSVLADRYRLEEVIGRGGMSTVYRATDTVLDRTVAVKVLLGTLAESDPTHVTRFEREARAVAALRHPSVVKIYDAGVHAGTHFIVMECVEGQGLDEVLRNGRALDPEEATRIAARVADALAAAHAAGILHRDIKPANVMVGPGEEVRVLDFGIARAQQDATLTQPSAALGTAPYMPPERVSGEPGDERSDIYSLGCLLYALLAGAPPFSGDSTVAILHQQVHADPAPLRDLVKDLAPALDLLVLRMLAKDPAARPQSAAEVAARLGDPGRGAMPVAGPSAGEPRAWTTAPTRRQPLAPAGVAPPATGLGELSRAAARTRGRRKRLPALGIVAAVALALVLILSASGGPKGRPSLAAIARRATPLGSVTPAASRARTHPATTAPAPSTSPTPQPAQPVHQPPHHGGSPPGHTPGGPPGHKEKGTKPPKHEGKPPKGGDGGD